MHPVFFLVALVIGLYLLTRYRSAPPAQRVQIRNQALLVGGALLLLLLMTRGGLGSVVAVLGGAGALAYRALRAAQFAHGLRGQYQGWRAAQARPQPGQSSRVRTRFVQMTLDHDSGEMTGVVLEGRHAGRTLSDLGPGELRELHEETAADAQSRAILEAYVERVLGESWGDGSGDPERTHAALSEHDARQILGVSQEAGRDEIIAAHRRLMQKLHPDRGGSTFLAAQINEAKRILLGD